MPAMKDEPGFELLPELFSIVGYESLILLCKFAGGETITIPTLEELTQNIDALQWYYDININKTKKLHEIPPELYDVYKKVEGRV
jgi:hypothetical protein